MKYEYRVYNGDTLYTNKEEIASEKLTRMFGEEGWELKGVLGDNLIFMRPNAASIAAAIAEEMLAVSKVDYKSSGTISESAIETNPKNKRKLKIENE